MKIYHHSEISLNKSICDLQRSVLLYGHFGCSSGRTWVLTVRLPPAEVVSKVTVSGVKNHTSVEAWGVKEGLFFKILLPVEDIGGGELGGHVGHEFAARKKTRKEDKFHLK